MDLFDSKIQTLTEPTLSLLCVSPMFDAHGDSKLQPVTEGDYLKKR